MTGGSVAPSARHQSNVLFRRAFVVVVEAFPHFVGGAAKGSDGNDRDTQREGDQTGDKCRVTAAEAWRATVRSVPPLDSRAGVGAERPPVVRSWRCSEAAIGQPAAESRHQNDQRSHTRRSAWSSPPCVAAHQPSAAQPGRPPFDSSRTEQRPVTFGGAGLRRCHLAHAVKAPPRFGRGVTKRRSGTVDATGRVG